MNLKTVLKSVGKFGAGGLIAVAGCAQNLSGPEVMKLAREGGAVVSYNGLGFDVMEKVSGEISDELGKLHVKGSRKGDNERFYEVLDEADIPGPGVWLLYHSLGCEDAFGLVKECKRRGISVRVAYSVGAFAEHEFPDNVGVVNNYFSSTFYIFGEKPTRGGRENYSETIDGSEHIGLPRKIKREIKDSIRRDCSRPLGYRRGVPRR